MKRIRLLSFGIASGCAAALLSALVPLQAASNLWNGGGDPDFNWSNAANWGGIAPAVTNDTLVFGGATGLLNTNDAAVTSLGSGAITFAAGAGSFVLSGSGITVGNPGGNDNIITNASANPQEIALNLTLAGGGRDRTIVLNGGGSLTLSGNIHYANDWLFPAGTAGTIIISGNNTGDGKGSVIVAGSNQLRAMMRNNVANTQLILGSDTALGNSGSGDVGAASANFRGLTANQALYVATTNGNRSLAGSTFAINSVWIDFKGENNLTIGNLINQGGNRDFKVTSTGQVTVQDSLSLSADQIGRNLYVNLSGAGGLVVNGKIYDTFHSAGLTNNPGTLRKAGTGTMTLNGDSSYASLTTVEGGTLVIGHANALGVASPTNGTTLTGNATLDFNGFTIGETLAINNSGNKLVNSSASAAAVTADANVNAPLTVDTTGDLTTARLICSAPSKVITKTGAGTLTTAGNNHNNLAAWQINAGTVVFANTSGYGADRGVTIDGGTLRLSGANFNLINDGQGFTLNSGVFDLNGKAEAVGAIAGTGGSIRNDLGSSTSTLYVGGGTAGTSSATFDGVVENGAGTLNFAKEGTGIQTLTGFSTYSGTTTISGGALALTGSASIANTPLITVASNATLDVSGLSSAFTLGASQKLAGNGSVAGSVIVNGTLAPGASLGALTFSNNLVLGGTLAVELDTADVRSNDLCVVLGAVTNLGAASVVVTNLGPALAIGDTFKLFSQPVVNGGAMTVTGGGLAVSQAWQNNLAVDGSIAVVSASSVATNPTNLTFSASGGNLTVSWPSDHIGWSLQTQTNSRSVGLVPATNAWFNLGYETTNTAVIPVSPAQPTVFYRLKYTLP